MFNPNKASLQLGAVISEYVFLIGFFMISALNPVFVRRSDYIKREGI